MTVHDLVYAGNSILKNPSSEIVNFNSSELKMLVEDLIVTMRENHGAGLAAPQIGIDLRVMVFEIKNNPRYPDVEEVDLTVLVNPSYEIISEVLTEEYEGCLSLPKMRGLARRYDHILYSAYDVNGNHFEKEAKGWHARVFQHEYDHLDGILYPERMHNMKEFSYLES
ncbi:peptide deformylase [Piscirickettsia litoralis]|uniref:Peptide deformylase n=1 Tax=Piscirickettsia litoralis TaxID=1891921 RepID=A0ABX3A0F8_9GAMM|nr:peptide deformylase [Piscirickettsia litoralis]ODN40945.1 peptide deformylase [Piscirickettsia litoralis]